MRHVLFLLASLLLAVPAGAEPLGRLFLSADERALLDRQRAEGTLEAPRRTLRLDGKVSRAGETQTIWIDQRPRRAPATGAVADLRVGESLDLARRESHDLLAPGRIHVAPRKH